MNLTIRRHLLGVLSLLLLSAAPVLLLVFEGNQYDMAGSLCLRAGLVMGAIWLALPQLLTMGAGWPPRLILAIAIGVVVAVVRPKAIPIVLLVIAAVAILEAVGWLLRPAKKKGRPSHVTGKKPGRKQ